MEQSERLDYLLAGLLKEDQKYADIRIPEDISDKQRLLRSLFNLRLPGTADPELLQVQDEYLKQRSREKGIVAAADIETIAQQGSDHPFADILALYQGDITTIACDAIMNAANSQMLGCFVPLHNCIDNCIHTYAGMQLRNECFRQMQDLRRLYGEDYEQPTAKPLISKAYNLPCRYVIHVVGPIVQGPLKAQDRQDLYDCYENVMSLAQEKDIRTLAFCCLSTGVFGFPQAEATKIAVKACLDYLNRNPYQFDKLIFNVFRDEDLYLYQQVLF